jgi:superfamily II DNA or RNA helicase
MSKIFEERPYQQRIIAKADANWRDGVKSQIVVSPTGSGKSYMGLNILKNIVTNANTILGCEPSEVGIAWMAMRGNLLKQAQTENEVIGCPNIHYLSMFNKDPLEELSRYKKIILNSDEAHHDATDSASAIHNKLNPVFCLGLSATPIRTDRMKLCFEVTLQDAGYHNLIQDGYLSQFDQFMLNEFTPRSVSSAYLADIQKWGKSLMFFLTYQECLECAGLLRDAGVRCDIVTGNTDRNAQIDAFEAGDLDVLINMFVLTEGFDCPDLRTVWVRDSANKGPTVQMAGRVLRKHHSKPFANIIQSVKTSYPFARVAKPHHQLIQQDGVWRSIGASEMVRMMSHMMIQRVIKADIDYESLNYLKNKAQGRVHRWR